MIHHLSISAQNPRRVAEVLSEIMNAHVMAAPPEFPQDSWFVMTGDRNGSLIEVMPFGTELRPGGEQAAQFVWNNPKTPYSASHALVSVQTEADWILRIGRREGWAMKRCNRGPFELIECWIENRQLLEFTTPEMTIQYLSFFNSPEGMQAALKQFVEQ